MHNPSSKEQESIYRALIPRVGRLHLRQRLGIESEGEAPVFGQGRTFFHLENWFSFHLEFCGARISASLIPASVSQSAGK